MAHAIDWDAVADEATALLREYVRIDTSNPPGNEAKAAAFLEQVLAADGIASEIVESAPGRANLRAAIGPGGRGLCLLNHTDVVPVEARFWDVPAFDGLLKDGYVYGRGTLDMKGMAIMELMTFLLLKRNGVELRRRLTYLAVADEEAGSAYGASWLAENQPGWLEADLVINEGGYGLIGLAGRDVPLFQVASSEKIPLWLELTARGRPGHGSVPHGDNCADRLIAALGRIAAWERPRRLLPLMRAHLEGLREAGLAGWESEGEAVALGDANVAIAARLTNTVTLTTLAAGIKANVIPAEASATLDCRLLPDVDCDAFINELRQVIADERVEIEVLNRFVGAESPLDNELVRVAREVVQEMVEGSRLVPEMMAAFTDSRIYRVRGIPAYGFVPCLLNPSELAGIHGNNERISVDSLKLGTQVLYEVVRRLCT